MRKKQLLWPIIVLALSFVVAIVLARPIGVSTEYSITSGIIENIVTQGQAHHEYYHQNHHQLAKAIASPMTYGMLFVLSIPFGAWIASRVLHQKQAIQTKEVTRPKWTRHPITLFIGGFLLLFGARFAGGCTSGHMMSGIMQSSVSGLVFAGVVFITAIITALLVYRRKGGQ